MALVKVPVPVPLVVKLLASVGLAVVAQHTPLAVTDEPPSEVTFPPELAEVCVMEVAVVVVTTAAPEVVKVRSSP
jgi:hypothetical protein